MEKLDFIKMHGLGNDFVIIDRRQKNILINENIIEKISDRKTGAGCDQIITIDNPKSDITDARITIYNSDGDEAEACGNGTRCVAKILSKEMKKSNIILDSPSGQLLASLNSDGNISVNMGNVRESWSDIPLIKKMDNQNIPIKIDNFSSGFALNIGNPHIVFFGNNIGEIDLSNIGPGIENHNFFPKKTNVEFIEIINHKKIKMRVWERGVGETLACGSGACAAVYAGFKKEIIEKECEVVFKKGSLKIKVNSDHVIMTGPAEISYYGNIQI
ncbi:MAG: Diaminopimelate epimerase [Alphaproteobacteria bacterium MarineAlpha5_Bin11]|nr:diaminopimelate epimerase [Pelagibacteraceae bacterium]PPR44005.1 MAG: Diaminopimelate epimerase [Alphaproteobacteria bacterium MarineAlpha5_Bin11]PPR51226.1 MAG: Diaminopimelate epimerase [Alphaproteobacteria bacterium MarineAlpha5_Bin10]|tara:strand:- start:4773 stop:5591 length:819 start_codon:yes stop_codon:yes gene_type:complete